MIPTGPNLPTVYRLQHKYRQHMHSEGFINALLAILTYVFQSNYTSYDTPYIALWVIVHVQGQNGAGMWPQRLWTNPTRTVMVLLATQTQKSSMDSIRSARVGGENYCCSYCWVLLVFSPQLLHCFLLLLQSCIFMYINYTPLDAYWMYFTKRKTNWQSRQHS